MGIFFPKLQKNPVLINRPIIEKECSSKIGRVKKRFGIKFQI